MVGQINLGTRLGNVIYEISKRNDIENIVEIGTWNGLGSTLCVLTAIRGLSKNFFSVELYDDMYMQAIDNLRLHISLQTHDGYTTDRSGQLKILNGSVVDFDDIACLDFSNIRKSIENGIGPSELHLEHARLWFEKDILAVKNSVNIIDMLPQHIDLLILDGGEYTTYYEWLKLRDRTRIFILDDTKLFKNKRVRDEMLANEKYRVLIDEQEDRNGYAVFETA